MNVKYNTTTFEASEHTSKGHEIEVTGRICSPVLRNMTVGQASYIYASAGIAVEVNEGCRVKFVEGVGA